MGVRQGGLSISESIFTHTTVSSICKEWCEKQKASGENGHTGYNKITGVATVLWGAVSLNTQHVVEVGSHQLRDRKLQLERGQA